jgi:hypothetical protein
MQSIVSLIASYNPHNPYVGLVIEELSKVSDVVLFTTEEHNYPVTETCYFEKTISENLVYEPRKWILNNIERSWDYVLYNEDDILIPEESVKRVLELYNTLPGNLKPGFARYEVLGDGIKRYIDLHPKHSVHRGGNTIIKEVFKEEQVWEPWNLHSGNYIFSKEDIRKLVNGEELVTEFIPFNTYGILETAASALYNSYNKVLPRDVESVACYHLPNKYIPLQGGPTSLEIEEEYKNKI